jgi:hypothetical protein
MSRRTIQLANELQRFAKQYGRKAQRKVEPNDRKYSRKAEKSMVRLKPETLSALLSDDADHPVPPPKGRKKK